MSEPEISLLVGSRGAGKTTILNEIIKPATFHIVMTTKPSGFTARQGWKQVTTPDQLLEVLTKNYLSKKLKICLRVLAGPKEKILPIFTLDRVSNLLYQVQDMALRKNMLKPIGLTVDEAHRFYPHHRPKDMDGFDWVISEGREWGIHLIFATQRPTNVPPIFRDNVQNWYVLMLGGDTAIKTIKELVGRSLKTVPQYRYALYRGGILTHEGSTRKPKIVHRLP